MLGGNTLPHFALGSRLVNHKYVGLIFGAEVCILETP